MKTETVKKKEIMVLRILENLDIKSDISDLQKVIEDIIEKGDVSIAVSLTPNSRLSSMSIGMLLRFYSILKEQGGKLSLVQPNKEDAELLKLLSFTSVMEIFESEDELLNKGDL